jgi:predicted lipid-binding transport protein (Tim44 family)
VLAEFLLVFAMGEAAPMPRDLEASASPQASLAHNRRVALFMFTAASAMATAAGVIAGVVAGVLDGLVAGVVAGLAGLLLYSRRAAWPQYALAKTLLALRRRLPWQLMEFLADAHQRGILQQSGSVYQFRHIELQGWLATRRNLAPRENRRQAQNSHVRV